tara:strand:+ start:743 stop:988 length:246 start_codon:yes stop_codon:yes gene_type:complete
MNDLTVLIFALFFVGIAGATFAFMFKMMTVTLADLNKPISRVDNVHPEMQDVRSGESLLVFHAPEEDEDTDDDGDIIIVRK